MELLRKISEYAAGKPDEIAFNLNMVEKLTYEELEKYSNQLAEFLNKEVPNDKSPIIVYGHKSPYMLVSFLGCVKAGHPYCPVDISTPDIRTKEIIVQVKPHIILTTEPLELEGCHNILKLEQLCKICRDKKKSNITERSQVSGEDVFYIIFTSGSTGIPKGVQITADCLDNFLKWSVTLGNKDLENKKNTFINQAPFSFDLSVMDIYTSLYVGGTLWLLDKKIQGNMGSLLNSLKHSNANVWVSTPSFVKLCLGDEKFKEELMPDLELFLFCGEILPNQTTEKLHKRFPKASVVNTYGPTESTVAVTQIVVTREINEQKQPLPVGAAKPGTFIYIMDKLGNILPEGEKGEIVIVGDTVSLGYYKQPDLTNKVFGVRNVNGDEYRLYRTGDEGYIVDNQLYYTGRIDLQIKLHGYRMEIEDVENNIMKIPGVEHAVVLPKTEEGQVKSIIAIVQVEFEVVNSFKSSQYLRKEMKHFVPEYMIPQKFIFTDGFPMTNNGKINRKLLEEMI